MYIHNIIVSPHIFDESMLREPGYLSNLKTALEAIFQAEIILTSNVKTGLSSFQDAIENIPNRNAKYHILKYYVEMRKKRGRRSSVPPVLTTPHQGCPDLSDVSQMQVPKPTFALVSDASCSVDAAVPTVNVNEFSFSSQAEDIRRARSMPGIKKEAEFVLTPSVWERLDKKTQSFVCESLFDFRQRGSDPERNYTPVVNSLGNAIERECQVIVEQWCATQKGLSVGEYHKSDMTSRALDVAITSGKMPALGSYPYLFRVANLADVNILTRWKTFVLGFARGKIITQEHIIKDIEKVVQLRNPGGHAGVLTIAEAQRIMDLVLGVDGKPGLLRRLHGG
jgi:hypothetical protein